MRKYNDMAKNLLLDTGFWYALYDDRDSHYEDARILVDLLDLHNLIIPWPCLYETLNTRFVKRREWLESFSAYVMRNNTVHLPDDEYRPHALGRVFRSQTPWLSVSLVDEVIRSALLDPNIKIDAMITFNQSDFYDICYPRNIELIGS
jgi:predicted nucleic acid-binding protein